ncbi:MAG: transcriptional regulator of arginine metabolism [Thermoanaerobacter sp.]|nr:transcriptional regulator of arginine metabolism [Thermoanaerobacter sp.]
MKARRQRKILEIIRRELVETQEDLAAALKKSGFEVTQATISRDIKELGLIKIPAENNLFRYALPGQPPAYRSEERLRRLFRDSVVGMDLSENLIVIKTHPGGAQAVASAIDQAGWQEIIGTVGGDDTILVVIKPKRATAAVLKRFEELNRG